MWLAVVTVFVALAILVWSADIFINGATTLAKQLRVPGFLVGMLILGLGSSAPEMVVSVLAALQDSPELALGNAYGSNIINIALVLGATAIISPIIIHQDIIKRKLPLLLIITVLAAWQLRDGVLNQADGVLLLGGMVLVLTTQIVLSLRENHPKNNYKNDAIVGKDSTGSLDLIVNASEESSLTYSVSSIIIGMLMLVISSQAVVWGAVVLATFWGLSELVIGLTIVAVGTSLPELVASLAAARKGEHDMVLGNIIGSNIFNTLGVVGLAAIIAPITANPMILSRDILAMGAVTFLLVALCAISFMTKRQLGRLSGITLLLFFTGYTIWLIETVNM